MEKTKRFFNSLNFRLIIILYTCFLLIVCSLAIYYSYYERQNMYINKFNSTAEMLEKEYTNVLDNFWKIYMPVFEEQDTNYEILNSYFSKQNPLTPVEKRDLAKVLKQMLMRDDRLQWLAVYRGEESDNYILFFGSDTLVKMDETFPYWENLLQKDAQMEVYGTKPIYAGEYTVQTFALAGGATNSSNAEGAVVAGYDLSCFNQYLDSYVDDNIFADYIIKNTHGTVFHSNNVPAYEDFDPAPNQEGIVVLSDNQRYYTKTLSTAGRLSYEITYFTTWGPLFLHSILTTVLIASLFIAFSLVAYYLYITEIKKMSQKITESTLAEIQAKFNPHFLYNFLEALREKIYATGDYESAESLVTLSAIFRKLVSGENFVTIREEITFCDMYISLLKNYYSNDLDIIYDIDSDILHYGIIRNLLQPLVENYFVHGFNPQDSQNGYISIKGSVVENQYIVITYEDNGSGMSAEELETLKEQLLSDTVGSSYGLKSIYRRIKLFYGKDCGIQISANKPNGIIIQLKIKKLTLEEHNTQF